MNQHYTKITYVSNAGVLIEINDKKILIDALCSFKSPFYKSTPKNIWDQIIKGTPPFDGIDVMLITHHHRDHFDVGGVSEFLDQNPNAVVISTPEVISSIRSHVCDIKDINLITLNFGFHCREKVKVNGVDIESISMIHEGKEYGQTNNLAFLIEYDGVKVLHLGDAAPVRENFEFLNLKEYSINLLIASFPYAGLPGARKIIRDYINPKKICIVHLPHRELDSDGWIDTTKRSYGRVKNNFVQTIFLEDIGGTVSI